MSSSQRLRVRRLTVRFIAGAALGLCAAAGSCGGSPPAPAKWYVSCGDPVCRGYSPKAGVPACTTEKLGDSCPTVNASCDPMDSCNMVYLCTTSDPQKGPGGCPISRRQYKTDIAYLDESGLQQFADELSRVKLATYRYKTGGPRRLGFIIEDHEPSVSIDSGRDMVDLYGYTSMAVAALQVQKQQLAALQKQVAELSAQLKAEKARRR